MSKVGQEKAVKQLGVYRKELDKLDTDIIKLLGKRNKVINKVAVLKVKMDMPVFVADRNAEVIKRVTKMAAKWGVNKEFIREMYRSMIMHSCTLQEELIKKKKKKSRSKKT